MDSVVPAVAISPASHIYIFHDERTSDLAEWIQGVSSSRLCPPFATVTACCCTDEDEYEALCTSTLEKQGLCDPKKDCCPAQLGTPSGGERSSTLKCLLILAIFWDGQSADSKNMFLRMRRVAANVPTLGGTTSVFIQVLNAKKGQHTLHENDAALVASILKRVPTPTALANDMGVVVPKQYQDPAAKLSATSPSYEAVSLERLSVRLEEGQGECIWLICEPREQFKAEQARLFKVAKELNCQCAPVVEEVRTLAGSSNNPGDAPRVAQEFMVRIVAGNGSLPRFEMRLAMCGNVDSGKSTLTAVLTRGCCDDGRGLARASVFKHRHELDSGRTSSISENYLGFDGSGHVMNYNENMSEITKAWHETTGATTLSDKVHPEQQEHASSATGKKTHAHGTHLFRSRQELSNCSSKLLTLYDLAGHEKYLKTTVLGMTRNFPDYACIVISANNGIQRMTKEHLALCLALKLPFFIVVTRIDSTPENIRSETMTNIHKLLRISTVRKMPYPIRKIDDVVVTSRNLRHDRITPIFEVSNLTGHGIPFLLRFLNLLPVRQRWREQVAMSKEMIIDNVFFVMGVGTVVGGIVTQGKFSSNDTVLLGPDTLGKFRPVQIKSIHVQGHEVPSVEAGNDAALCLKKERRNAIRKGNVCVCQSAHPKTYWQFDADITVLYHSTTIAANYEPVIHAPTVRQCARILHVEKEFLRTGDCAKVRFHFLYRPEYLKVGQRIIFREGRTKGIGLVTNLVEKAEENRRFRKKGHTA